MANEAYHAALAIEEDNRLRATFPRQRPLDIPHRCGGGLAQFPLATLTWGHVRGLTYSGNAFFRGGVAPLLGDVHEFLWTLHPYYRTAEGNYPNSGAAGGRAPSRLVSWLALLVVTWHARRLDLVAAELAIRECIARAYQDQPAGRSRKKGEPAPTVSLLAPRLNRFDEVSYYFVEKGWSLDQVFAAGVAFTMQLYRTHLIANGEEERCIPPSAALIEFEAEDHPDGLPVGKETQ